MHPDDLIRSALSSEAKFLAARAWIVHLGPAGAGEDPPPPHELSPLQNQGAVDPNLQQKAGRREAFMQRVVSSAGHRLRQTLRAAGGTHSLGPGPAQGGPAMPQAQEGVAQDAKV